MSNKTVVVNYGIGNVFSVCNALQRIGGGPELTSDMAAIRNADRVILPGVGAFARAMDALHQTGLSDTLRDFVATGRPFLGICIGMQVLMDRSTEFGETAGLGFVPGDVRRIPNKGPAGNHLRIPHIGWAPLRSSGSGDGCWAGTPLANTMSGDDAVYFVHSYHCMPDDPLDQIAFADYGGERVTAAVRHGNIMGVQFHPERSGVVGQNILRTFLNL